MTSRIPAVVLRQSKYVPKVEFVCVGKLLKDIMLLRFQLPLGLLVQSVLQNGKPQSPRCAVCLNSMQLQTRILQHFLLSTGFNGKADGQTRQGLTRLMTS